jgi:hypothetical protein
MKTIFNLRNLLFVFIAVLLYSCASNPYSNRGTSSDRTGKNGATNGTGKPPRTTAHNVKY